MAFSSLGSEEAQRTMFNYGYISNGSTYLTDVENIAITEGWTEKNFRALNTHFKKALRRGEYNAELTFTMRGDSTLLNQYFYSSESVVSGTEKLYDPFDGQQDSLTGLTFTCYENDSKNTGYQFTVDTPVILSLNPTFGVEDYVSTEVTLACKKFTNKRVITS